MQRFLDINDWRLLKPIQKRIRGLTCIYVFLFCSCSQKLKIFKTRNQLKKKNWTHEILTRKNFGPTNTYEKKFGPANTHEKKFRIHECPRENFEPTKYPWKKIQNPRNTHEKKFQTHEIPTRKKILDPSNTLEGIMAVNPRQHVTQEI